MVVARRARARTPSRALSSCRRSRARGAERSIANVHPETSRSHARASRTDASSREPGDAQRSTLTRFHPSRVVHAFSALDDAARIARARIDAK